MIVSTKEGEKVMSDISGVYCSNCNCEYHEDGDCEYEGSLSLDENGTCQCYRGKDTYSAYDGTFLNI